MRLSNKDVEAVIEKLKFHKLEIEHCGNIKKANDAFAFATKKICEIIQCKRFDLFKDLINTKDPTIISAISLFLLPISEIKTLKRLAKLFFIKEYSFRFLTS